MKRKYFSWDECINLREIQSLRKLRHPNIGECNAEIIGFESTPWRYHALFLLQGCEYSVFHMLCYFSFSQTKNHLFLYSQTEGGNPRKRHSAHGIWELGNELVRFHERPQKAFSWVPAAKYNVPNFAGTIHIHYRSFLCILSTVCASWCGITHACVDDRRECGTLKYTPANK